MTERAQQERIALGRGQREDVRREARFDLHRRDELVDGSEALGARGVLLTLPTPDRAAPHALRAPSGNAGEEAPRAPSVAQRPLERHEPRLLQHVLQVVRVAEQGRDQAAQPPGVAEQLLDLGDGMACAHRGKGSRGTQIGASPLTAQFGARHRTVQ
jgi:hypothetical protein